MILIDCVLMKTPQFGRKQKCFVVVDEARDGHAEQWIWAQKAYLIGDFGTNDALLCRGSLLDLRVEVDFVINRRGSD